MRLELRADLRRQGRPRAEPVDEPDPKQHREGREDDRERQRLQAQTPEPPRVADARGAEGQGRENERDDDHADEAQEDLAERFGHVAGPEIQAVVDAVAVPVLGIDDAFGRRRPRRQPAGADAERAAKQESAQDLEVQGNPPPRLPRRGFRVRFVAHGSSFPDRGPDSERKAPRRAAS
mgnify:CR=1 FL=1